MRTAALLLAVLVTGCGNTPTDGQSLADGIAALCEGGSPTNATALEVADLLDDETRPKVERLLTLRAAVERVELATCARLDTMATFTPPPTAQVPVRDMPGGPPVRLITIRDVRVDGPCDAGDVESIIEARQNGLQYCYERALARSPDLAGDLTLAGTIDTTGSVVDVTVEPGTLDDDTLTACMRRQFVRWRFPPGQAEPCTVEFTVDCRAPD